MKLTGDRNQCPTCGEYFNSTRAFDKHRTGKFGKKLPDGTYKPSNRRCMDAKEMTSAGMSTNHAGFWITAKMPPHRGFAGIV